MTASTPTLLLATKCCGQCLTTRNRIVSGARAAEIITECRAQQNHFFCHKGGAQKVHCRGVHDLLLAKHGGSRAYRFAQFSGVPVVLVDADQLERAP